MKKRLLVALGLAVAAVPLAYYLIFSVPSNPQLISFEANQSQEEQVCYQGESNKIIDEKGKLSVLVWNIYKQNRDNWQQELEVFSDNSQLILLQEASLDAGFIGWLKTQHWASNHVSAFRAFETSAGVLNLATEMPSKACAFIQKEPWLRLPKSGLYATYELSNGQSIAVINIHAINFTVGTVEFKEQLVALRNAVDKHQGPMIIAGDFNTWSEERTETLENLMDSLSMEEVTFSPDHRTQFITGLVLDHIYYRGLVLETAEAPITDASDHNPLLATFSLQEE
ncbi:endonuclease/exonuclease/phosphatase family protein [Vibrio tapetis subsp. quintayensis]|uniref:endonuclease/exonuclease/phosphatase family protein n=1 Tax=Vibrio tapetis TaxID=52443 RepID=UPI0025B30DFA|nr:endonuclease/exonuclease/phosphatase family protein [Vibrio tapetis]MDN3682695.1 endonuclease/exonuclease/phosphatase family protein [Vibrio tapetis subsp. quintayensis]